MPETEEQSLEQRLQLLEKRMNAIETRNSSVTKDKAWETSLFRIFLISIVTYGITGVVFWLIAVPSPFLNAFIPTVGYFLSTQSLPFIKAWWIAKQP